MGIAQTLFGTVLLYMAVERVLGSQGGALLWTHRDGVKDQLDPSIITLAFAFLFIGYGTKVGLSTGCGPARGGGRCLRPGGNHRPQKPRYWPKRRR